MEIHEYNQIPSIDIANKMNHFSPEFVSKGRDQNSLETGPAIHFRQPLHLRSSNIQQQTQDQCQATFISQGPPPPPPPYTSRMDPNQPSIVTSLIPHHLSDEQQFGRHYTLPLQHQDLRNRQISSGERQDLCNHFGQVDSTFSSTVHPGIVDPSNNTGYTTFTGLRSNDLLSVAPLYSSRDDQQVCSVILFDSVSYNQPTIFIYLSCSKTRSTCINYHLYGTNIYLSKLFIQRIQIFHTPIKIAFYLSNVFHLKIKSTLLIDWIIM